MLTLAISAAAGIYNYNDNGDMIASVSNNETFSLEYDKNGGLMYFSYSGNVADLRAGKKGAHT
jgi:hypothetical protein